MQQGACGQESSQEQWMDGIKNWNTGKLWVPCFGLTKGTTL